MPAKRGNQNALKHGLYAQRFTIPEKLNLGKMPPDDLRQEMAMVRVVIDRIFELLTKDPTAAAGTKVISTDDTTKLVNSLTNAITALNTTARTHALLNGTYSPLNDALMEALTSVPAYASDVDE